MNPKLKFANALYIANVIVMLAIGLAFVFKSEFMPFHGDVIQTTWNNVSPLAQTLYLGMMRTEGAGFLASAVALTFLLWASLKRQEQWLYVAMTTVGIVEYTPSLAANLHVASVTDATPPWALMLTLILSLLVALFLALRSSDAQARIQH